MKKNEYKILIVFVIMMSLLIGYLGWVTMEKRTIDVDKKIIYQAKRVKSEKSHVESISNKEKILVNNHANDEHIVSPTENKKNRYSAREVDTVDTEQVSNRVETKNIEDVENPQMDDSLPSDEILEQDEEPPVDLETVEDLEVLGYSTEEAKRIVEEQKRVRKNPNMPMPLSINPKIIEDMRILGYSKEEAQKIINENMSNPKVLDGILLNIDRGLSDLKTQ